MSSSSSGGGVPARRAVVRWAWRLFRREWRQQVLVLALLTLAVAAAIGVASAAYNVAPVPGNADFGTADHYFQFVDPDPATLPTKLAAAEDWFGTIDVITHRAVAVPGSVQKVDYRSQDPDGPYGKPMLDLRNGRYPTAADEVAVSDWVAATFDLHIGSAFALDGVQRTVVGIVENPSDLSDKFALVAPDPTAPADSVSVLVDASEQKVLGFHPPGDNHRMIGARGAVSESVVAAIGVFVVATVALFLVALVAAASFVVVAQRRQRQLGMLSALGATEKHLRLVMVASGAVIGGVAAVVGSAIGVLAWIALASRLEHAIGYRVDAFNVPWWLVAVGMMLAVATAVGAAWWPARAAARMPTVAALSGRPPRPTAAHRSAGLAALFCVGGVGCLVIAGDVAKDGGVRWTNLLLVVAGTIGTVVGVLLVSPLAIRALAAMSSLLPISIRLPLRDLGRYQARSGAALAAISLTLGVPVAIIATASAAESSAVAGNLSDHQLLVHTADLDGPFVPLATDVASLQEGVDHIAASLDDTTVVPIDVALDPAVPSEGDVAGREAINVGRRETEHRWNVVSLVYVATPALLDHYGIDIASLDSTTVFLTVEPGEIGILGASGKVAGQTRPDIETVTTAFSLTPGYTSLPGSFITPAELGRRGWESASSGQWLIETTEPLTNAQLSTARRVAAASGLTIESRDTQSGLSALRTSATAVGIALALGILAMTVGLIRSEASGDLRTLAAAGASSSTRRTLTAATAGGLALLGAVLGIVGAYVALAAGPFGQLSRLEHVPYAQLVMIVCGTPLIAACTGWLLAGREPAALGRRPIV